MDEPSVPLSREELTLEGGELLPAKEVLSILDLVVNVDIALDLAAPIDLAVAANANIAAPVDAAATANVLSFGSSAQALADQGLILEQHLSGEAIASAPQTAVIDQSNDIVDGGTTGDTGGTATDPVTDPGTNVLVGGAAGDPTQVTAPAATDPVGDITGNGLLDGPLLNVDVDLALDADLAAPVAGAVAANANAAAPIDAAVSANVLSFGSESIAIADQDAMITQTLDGVTASATATQDAEITQ